MIVLDTNVLSELLRPTPDPRVLEWVDRREADRLWLTSMTAAELLSGVALLPEGERKRRLGGSVARLLHEVFARRVLPFGTSEAVEYARIVSARRRTGAPIGTADAVIAATVLAAGAEALATRDSGGFAGTGITVVDPWTAG